MDNTEITKTQPIIDKEQEWLSVLCRDYMVAYYINTDKNKLEVLKVAKHSHACHMPGVKAGAVLDYKKHVHSFSEQFIVSDKEKFKNKLSCDYISEKLNTAERFSFRYKCTPNFLGNQSYELQAVRINPEKFDGKLILVSREIDNIIAAEKRKLREINTSKRYLEVLTRDFVAVYHVNLKENTSSLIKVDSNLFGYDSSKVALRKKNNYIERVSTYCDKFVVFGYKNEFLRSMEPENTISELKTNSRFTYRYKTIQQNGAQKFFELQALRMNLESDNGDVLIAFRDIDDIVTAEQRHRIELEERFETEKSQNEVLRALGQNYHAIFRIDLLKDSFQKIFCRDEINYFYNESAPSATQMLTEVCENIVAAEYFSKMERFFNLSTIAKRLKNNEYVEAECETKDGSWHRARIIVKRRDKLGEATHVLYVTQVINDEKEYEEHLLEKVEYAELANRSKTEFISKVAHDIRTPMNSLFGFLQIAESNLDDIEKLKYSLSKIRIVGEFLRELVDDVLDISRIENGKMTLHPKAVNVRRIFDELPTSMGADNFGKKIKFNYNIHDIFCEDIIADSLRLKQIYTNILSNAIKYTPDGGVVDFEIHEDPTEHKDKVRIVVVVADNGIGMSDEFMDKMFVKFERETDTRLNNVSGYGLGLSIVRQLVDMMDGHLDVSSKLGEGTKFIVKIDFPIAQESPKQAVKRPKKISCEGMHLLVAEDNELSREVMNELLSMNGITCDMAFDGAMCTEMFSSAPPDKYDAILMDMQMPNVNGIEATKRIRSLNKENASSVPIIALTANALSSDVKLCMEAGLDMHLSKPIDIEKLLNALHELTAKKN